MAGRTDYKRKVLLRLLKIEVMKNTIFSTNNDWTGLILRLTLGLILFPHGAQKALGMFGGYGFTGTMGFFTDTMHLPWITGFLVIIIEFVGALSFIAGFASRIWSGLTITLFIGIIFSSHLDNGFFMNWYGNQKGEGFEFHLLIIGLAIATQINGSGKYSVDERLIKIPKDTEAQPIASVLRNAG
jgi:putative oxidoreductase